ncbi:MAG TPA: hypothetical protein VGM76_01560 [Lacipirellulaceae bacterium]|jgi:ElaB/YqjD/DUF883 family membrane-anchored ribosome-binding protein
MSSDTKHNGRASEEATPSRPSVEALSETEFLSREISDARAALKRSVAELKPSAVSALDLTAWAKAYPWPAVGAAAATGFALAALLASRRKPAKVDNPVAPTRSPQATCVSDPPTQPPTPSFFASVSPALFDLAKLIIETMIMTALRGAQTPDQQGQSRDQDLQQ